jgi:hypothetical protein
MYNLYEIDFEIGLCLICHAFVELGHFCRVEAAITHKYSNNEILLFLNLASFSYKTNLWVYKYSLFLTKAVYELVFKG